jgi:hypothetical protein
MQLHACRFRLGRKKHTEFVLQFSIFWQYLVSKLQKVQEFESGKSIYHLIFSELFFGFDKLKCKTYLIEKNFANWHGLQKCFCRLTNSLLNKTHICNSELSDMVDLDTKIMEQNNTSLFFFIIICLTSLSVNNSSFPWPIFFKLYRVIVNGNLRVDILLDKFYFCHCRVSCILELYPMKNSLL